MYFFFFFIFSAYHLCFLRAPRVVSLACSKPKRPLFPFFFVLCLRALLFVVSFFFFRSACEVGKRALGLPFGVFFSVFQNAYGLGSFLLLIFFHFEALSV